MQHKPIMIALLPLFVAVVLCISACAACVPSAPAPTVPSAQPSPTAVPAPTTAPEVDSGNAALQEQYAAYRAALHALLQSHVLPDGTDCGFDASMDPAGNQFAVSDVDFDGNSELVILYTTTFTGGQIACIYAYSEAERQLVPELMEYPLLTFYNNGVIQAGWSHNQGLAGSFWPYTLYRYDADTDIYRNAGMADAWEKSFAPTDFNGDPFPDGVDASGAGIVYYIMPNGEYEEVAPSDEAAYQAWRTSYLDGAKEMQLPFEAMTSENIDRLLGA